MDDPSTRPNWDRLFEISGAQEGYFTTQQAAAAGYSPQLLVKHQRAGRVVRTRRGIYRLVHFPAGENESLVIAWLWSGQEGVVSHQTALSLHGLSDALPAKVHLSLPSAWKVRRVKVPSGLVLHFADVADADRGWSGAIPVTTPARTLNDCARSGLSPDLLQQAAHEALRRGLVTRRELGDVDEALKPFGGLAA